MGITQSIHSIQRDLARVRQVRAAGWADPLQPAERARLANGVAGFVEFCARYIWVEDKESRGAVRFEMWKCQEQLSVDLVSGTWLLVLKARQLGLTWMIAAYAVWLIVFRSNQAIAVVSQDDDYAEAFVNRVRFILDRLPLNLAGKVTRDRDGEIEIRRPGSCSSVVAIACTRRALRSLSLDLVVLDEAALHQWLYEVRTAAQPAVELSGGQIVAISTSQGPSGEFFKMWNEARAKKSDFKPIFLDWTNHPRRNAAWYEATARKNAADPLYMKREYPATAEEAFEHAEGRVYPLFSFNEKFVRAIALQPEWKRYRAIDWGAVHPFVCLWGAIVPADPDSLTIDPSCESLIRELLAYSYDRKGDEPQDKDNHACDALRYMIITPGADGLSGHLHIYRELYVENAAAKGLDVPDLANKIITMSGGVTRTPRTPDAGALPPWQLKEADAGEKFELTVCDRSRLDNIQLLARMGIPAVGQRHMSGGRGGEIVQGITRVNTLVTGTAKGRHAALVPPRKSPGLPDELRRKGIY